MNYDTRGVVWPAPAKLNLFLHITGRRSDGYHLLQTVFQFLDIHDDVLLDVDTSGDVAALHHYPGFTHEDDLTLRAARLLQTETGCRAGVKINLVKNLPVGGGIGGGSSDAATVLMVLNQLWHTNLNQEELAAIGLRLGADVPVFIHGRACWAEGVGEDIQAIDLPEPVYLLVYPKVHVSTGQIFSAPELTRNTSPIKIADFLAGDARNDCESIVRDQVPEIDQAMQWLGQYSPARLTGTGSCVFAEFESHQQAQQAADQVPQDWQTWVSQGNNRSMLHSKLEEFFGV
jgi:4-diphosphocytidyl-2-C-methyl-D-erythritol kinase